MLLTFSVMRRGHYWKTHDDVIKWQHFPRHRPFVRWIHRSPVNSPHKGQWRGALIFSLICALNQQLSKQSWGWWFEAPSCLLWRHCNVDQYRDWRRYSSWFVHVISCHNIIWKSDCLVCFQRSEYQQPVPFRCRGWIIISVANVYVDIFQFAPIADFKDYVSILRL